MPRKPPAEQTFSLASEKGTDSRFVHLAVTHSQVRISTSDAGPGVSQFWQSGDEEYEFWVDVAAEGIPSLVFALLKEKYQGNLSAVNDFRSFCTENNIPHKFGQWFSR